MKTTIDQQTQVKALLDGGSELNIMPRRIFETLDLPIDTDIDWKINTYDSEETAASITKRGPLGVCHSVPIDVGGVEVKLPIFIVERSAQDLILGRP